MLKYIFEKFIEKVISNSFCWNLIYKFIYASNYLQIKKKKLNRNKSNWTKYQNLFVDLIVLNGPFKGMIYPSYDSAGSAFYPKLIGSYEKELHSDIEKLLSKGYSELVDVGCAEGYYAVGLALMDKNLKVYAYDIDDRARLLCKKMAEANGVLSRVTINSILDEDALAEFNFTGKGLIICDAEGFESKLFTSKSLQNIKHCDLIIETHDFMNLSISSTLQELFKETHHIKVIQSVDDVQKVKYYNYPFLSSISLDDKKKLLAEKRPSIMEWLVLESKD